MRSYVRSMAMATPTSRIASPTFHVPRLLTLNLTRGEGIDRGEVVLDGPRQIRRDRTSERSDRKGEEGEVRARTGTSSSTIYVRNGHLGGETSPDCVVLWTCGVEDSVASCGPSREASLHLELHARGGLPSQAQASTRSMAWKETMHPRCRKAE